MLIAYGMLMPDKGTTQVFKLEVLCMLAKDRNLLRT